jgi:DNA-directed RNA polymerase subunit RPC12/RpoP
VQPLQQAQRPDAHALLRPRPLHQLRRQRLRRTDPHQGPESRGNSSPTQLYICEICGEETLLDASTVAELAALAKAVIKLPSKNPTPTKNANNNTSQPLPKRKETQQPLFPAASNPAPSKKIVYYCKEHSEEEISYYCFTCWANICPECAIHGSHKDHEVKLIKKAISQVKGEYADIVGRVGESQSVMGKLKEGFLRLIKETNDRHTRERNTLSREFDVIRAALAAKEKELLRELDEINKQNLAALTGFLETINGNYEEANKVKRSIELINKKDEVLILEDYRKIGELEQTIASLNKTTDSIAGQSQHLNVEFLQQECKDIVEKVTTVRANLKREEIGSGTVGGVQRGAGGGGQ